MYVKHLCTSSFTALYKEINCNIVRFPLNCPCYGKIVNANKQYYKRIFQN